MQRIVVLLSINLEEKYPCAIFFFFLNEGDQEQMLFITYFRTQSYKYKNLNKDSIPKQISPSDLAVKFIDEL